MRTSSPTPPSTLPHHHHPLYHHTKFAHSLPQSLYIFKKNHYFCELKTFAGVTCNIAP